MQSLIHIPHHGVLRVETKHWIRIRRKRNVRNDDIHWHVLTEREWSDTEAGELVHYRDKIIVSRCDTLELAEIIAGQARLSRPLHVFMFPDDYELMMRELSRINVVWHG